MMRSVSHVIPRDDLIEHVVDGEGGCVCGPRLEVQHAGMGPAEWVYVHHSLDGRERYERI